MFAALALALVVRLLYIFGFKWNQGIGGDAAYYHYQANALARGLGFVDPWSWSGAPASVGGDVAGRIGVFPGAEHPPLYTLFLAIPSSLGFETFRQHLLAGGFLGCLTCGMVGIAGRAVAGARVGIIASFLAAVYANLWINDGLVLSETITALCVAVTVWRVYRFWRVPSIANAAWLGLAVGFLALSRAEVVFYFPIVAVPGCR